MKTVRLSRKGQVSIPKPIREKLSWTTGAELQITMSGQTVLIRHLPRKGTHNLAEVVGKYKYDGPPVGIEDLCKPVDLTENRR